MLFPWKNSLTCPPYLGCGFMGHLPTADQSLASFTHENICPVKATTATAFLLLRQGGKGDLSAQAWLVLPRKKLNALFSLGLFWEARAMQFSSAARTVDENVDYLFKVILIGDSNVGKTCVVQHFKSGVYSESQQNTIGVDFTVRSLEIDGKKVKVRGGPGVAPSFSLARGPILSINTEALKMILLSLPKGHKFYSQK